MFPCGLETVWKLCNILTFLQRTLSKHTGNPSKISCYDLLSVSIAAFVLEFSAQAVSPAVLTCTLAGPNSYSQQQPFACIRPEGQSVKAMRESCFAVNFCGSWHFVTAVYTTHLCRYEFCGDPLHILKLCGNLAEVSVCLGWDYHHCLGDMQYLHTHTPVLQEA